jgi:hypothetical protein
MIVPLADNVVKVSCSPMDQKIDFPLSILGYGDFLVRFYIRISLSSGPACGT